MALSAGTVAVDSSGTPTGSGLALSLYNQRKTPIDARLSAAGVTVDGDFWTGIAECANADAAAIVSYFTANGTAKIASSAAGDGLQTTPNPNNAATACTRPAADKFLPIV